LSAASEAPEGGVGRAGCAGCRGCAGLECEDWLGCAGWLECPGCEWWGELRRNFAGGGTESSRASRDRKAGASSRRGGVGDGTAVVLGKCIGQEERTGVAIVISHFVCILGYCFHPDFSLRPPIKSVLLLLITLM